MTLSLSFISSIACLSLSPLPQISYLLMAQEPADGFQSKIPEFWQQKYRKDLGKNWNLFYKRNETRFFRDRHWISQEFPELMEKDIKVFEVGCGVGNFLYPLGELNNQSSLFGCDISPRAIELFREHEQFDPKRYSVFVADITQESLGVGLEANVVGCIDFATCIFVLSALPPEALPFVIRNVWNTLRPGGKWFIRDYAADDAAQHRFNPSQSQLDRNLFVRQDGTLAHYFVPQDLIRLLENEGLFRVVENRIVHSTTSNVKKGLQLERSFVQIKLEKCFDD